MGKYYAFVENGRLHIAHDMDALPKGVPYREVNTTDLQCVRIGSDGLPEERPAAEVEMEKQKAEEAVARERLVEEKMRELAISELKKEGKLPADYKLPISQNQK